MHRRSSSRVLRSAALLAIASVAVTVAGAATEPRARETAQKLPWAAAGLSEREAAAHLLDRFAFGPRPGEVDRVVAMGLEAWLEAQLAGTVTETVYPEKVRSLDAWRLPASEITRAFPPPVVVRREAMRAGVVDRTMMEAPDAGKPPADAKDTERRRALFEFSREQGYRPQSELVGQLIAHKLLQAVYSENQLEAVLVDFWFNHFNVSLQDNQARGYLLSFERDAIAPGVLGKFGDLLAKVAAHPAMLFYLDNAQSTANPGAATTLDRRMTAAGFTGARGGDRTRPARAARAARARAAASST